MKRAQVLGLASFPVFTRKEATDVSYIANARKLLTRADRIYPQFATHNAHTVAAVLHMAEEIGLDPMAFEFQRLHGMGERLHDIVLEAQGTLNSRRLQFDKLDVKSVGTGPENEVAAGKALPQQPLPPSRRRLHTCPVSCTKHGCARPNPPHATADSLGPRMHHHWPTPHGILPKLPLPCCSTAHRSICSSITLKLTLKLTLQ